MPYRRLPNTDAARLRALKAAFDAGNRIVPQNLAFSQSNYSQLKNLFPIYKQTVETHKQTYKDRVEANKNYLTAFKETKLYLSHFIQVLNLSIIRNEFPKTARKFFGIKTDDKTVPLMNSEDELIIWGNTVITGEKERIAKGGNPIYSPKIAVVKVQYEKFIKLYRYQKKLQEIHDRTSAKLTDLRKTSDKIILSIWDQTEEYYKNLQPKNKRQICEEYGLVYVFRKKEKHFFDL